MDKFEIRGPKELKKEVIDKDLCSRCGACGNLCPYIDLVKAKPVIIADCDRSEGDCYQYCPKTFLDVSWLESKIFGSEKEDPILGNHNSIKRMRANDEEIRRNGQYGGIASALSTHLLESGRVDKLVLTKSGKDWKPQPTIVEEPEEVIKCAKSKYVASPVISALIEALDDGGEIGLVGTPCQITAARKIEAINGAELAVTIGLFCTWAMTEKFLEYASKVVDLESVEKFDIPPPPAEKIGAHADDKITEIPLDKIRKYIIPACNFCMDMTSEFSDVSIGQVEGLNDWNTVIVRSEVGEKIVDEAVEEGIFDVEELEEERLDHLKEAVKNRKKRVLKSMEEEDKKFIKLSKEYEKAITEA